MRGKFGRYGFNGFGWNSGINEAGFKVHVFGYDCACTYNNAGFYKGMVHYNGPHTNKYIGMNGATVKDGAVSDRHAVSDGCWGKLVGAMNEGMVLNIYIIAYANAVNVSTNHRMEPKGAMVSANDVSGDDGARG
jgi:hypothetical protein